MSGDLGSVSIGGMMLTIPKPAIWALAILLMTVFVLAGMSKLTGPSASRWSERFERWGYPAGTAALTGILEIAGGLALLFPKTRRIGAAMIVGLMLGALVTHLVHGEFPRLIPPFVLGGLALALYR